MITKLVAVLFVLISTFTGAYSSILIKRGSSTFNLSFSVLKNKNVIFGLILYGIGAIFFIIALKYVDLSILYPITSLTYVWISLLSIKLLKEKFNFWKWLGIISIIIGVSLLGLHI